MTLRARITNLIASLVVLVASGALAQDGKRPLGAGEIAKLLGSGVSQARVADLVDQRGVTFEVTPAIKEQLRAAGAGSEVLGAVDRASIQAERRKLEAERERAQRESGDAEDAPVAPARAAKGKGGDGMVTVPGGSFFMGCNQSVDSECDDDEKPGRTVDVPAFKIDKTEVTVAQFARCVDAGRCSSAGLTMPFYNGKDQPEFAEFCTWQKPGKEDHPINCVSWDQAVAFCEWTGKRLPTEVEWEKAARGPDGRKYPWGNAGYGAGGRVANIADQSAKQRFPDWTIAARYDDGYVGTAPVGSFPAGASPSGALEMVGNVWEWTSDPIQSGRAVRGGSWYDEKSRDARASNRFWTAAAMHFAHVGIRCAQ